MRKHLFFLLKVSLLALIILFLIRHTDINELLGAVRGFSAIAVLATVICIVLRFVFSTGRIKIGAEAAGIRVPFATLLRWEFEILFLELIIPVPDAEDMFRIVLWQKLKSGLSKTLTTLLFSRVCGLLVIAALLPFSVAMINEKIQIFALFPTQALWLFPFLLVIFVLMQKKILQLATAVLRKIKFIPGRITDTIALMAATDISAINYMAGCIMVFLALLFMAGGFYILALDIEIPISYEQLLLATPLYVVAFMLPFSLQGLGLPEAAMVWLLPYWGVKPEVAAAIGIIHFVCYVLIILIGTILVLADSDNKLMDIKNALRNFRNKEHQTLLTTKK